MDFCRNDTTNKLKFGWLKFGKVQMICQIPLTFLLPNIPLYRNPKLSTVDDISQQAAY